MGGIVSTVTRTFLQPFLAVVRFVSAASMEDTDTVEAPLEDCFYVENNYIFTPLVKAALKNRGWHSVPNSVALGVRTNANSEKEFAKRIVRFCTFMWIRWRTTIPFARLDSDKHIVNHISNEHILTIKSKLCNTMRSIADLTGEPLHPETFVMSELVADSELAAHLCSLPEVMWIIKPAVGSAGRDIRIARDGDALAQMIHESDEEAKRRSAAQEDQEEIFIVQRYIMSPLVLPGPTGRGHKFDMRVYFYIANVKPMLSFMFNDGYLRVNAEPYDLSDTTNHQAHITNFHVSKAHPQYDKMKDAVDGMNVRWTFTELEAHLQATYGGHEKAEGHDSVLAYIKYQIGQILRQVSLAVKDDLNPAPGCFALLGVDIIVDNNLKAWLIEFTKNPALRKNTPHLAALHSDLVQEICDIAIELRERRNANQGFDNLQSLQSFSIVANES